MSLSAQPIAAHPLVARGRQAYQARDFTAALSLCGMRLKEHPEDLEALELKAVILQARGDMKGAEGAMRQAIAYDSTCDWALHDLTQLLHGTGQKQAAETAAREALLARPDDPQAHLQLAVILGEKDDLPAAEFHNRRALDLAGPHPQILLNLALCLYNQGRIDEAEPLLLQASKLQPDNAMIFAHLSRIYEAKRDMINAWLWLDRAEQVGRKSGEDFTLLRALYLSNGDKVKDALDLIDKSNGGQRMSAAAQLDRARLLDRLGRYDEAWTGWVQAKARLGKDSGRSYDTARVTTEYAGLKDFFSADTLARLPKATARHDGPQPLFILGFPRSGTTMIEQMFNSHPLVAAGGELPFVYEWQALTRDLLPGTRPFPLRLAHTLTADFHHIPGVLRDYYLGRAATYGVMASGKPLFTDKMPLNDVYLPLIRIAFPQAPIVRMVRHPLDVAVSMLSHNLTHGDNCGYAIGTIMQHMVAMHDLTHHYDAVMEHPPLIVRYEDFIADQDGQTRRALSYAGLEFDAAALRFHENRRHAPTPSYAQVSKPLNDRSIARWRYYERYFEPYFDQIAPVVEALGYSLYANDAG